MRHTQREQQTWNSVTNMVADIQGAARREREAAEAKKK